MDDTDDIDDMDDMATRPLAPGVWGIVATPFSGSTFDLDEGSLARLVEHYEKIGVAGLTVLGVFGEASKLSSVERREVLETVVDTVDLPLVVGATALATPPVIEEVEQAMEVVGDRFAGAMVQINSADPETLAVHLRGIHEATGAGIVVQDYPAASGVSIASGTSANSATFVSKTTWYAPQALRKTSRGMRSPWPEPRLRQHHVRAARPAALSDRTLMTRIPGFIRHPRAVSNAMDEAYRLSLSTRLQVRNGG